MSVSDDRLALVADCDDGVGQAGARLPSPAVDSLPWVFAVVYRRPVPSAAEVGAALLCSALALLSALLLVQLALLRDAAAAAGVGAYPAALLLSLLTAALTLPAAAAAACRGGRPARRLRLAVAALLAASGALLVMAGRHRNRLGCNVQDPMVGLLIAFAFIGHVLTNGKRE